ncbi:MAG TPA: amino acid adenylation domain-containing protein, partial [Rhodocyclaceae bacterium]|nr:amino acid adenylation domain-containing protein [Rhodocyclaceae bacterium]
MSACSSRFKMQLACIDRGTDIDAKLIYNGSVFDGDTSRRMAEQLAALLACAVEDPDRRVNALDMLGNDSNAFAARITNAADYPAQTCMHRLFETQASTTPDALAVRCGNITMTYAELNAGANRLAAVLRQRRVGAEICVGVLLERSVDMLIAVLGVLKAGGAYVPLSLDSPHERLALQLAEIEAPVVVTQEKLLDRFSAFSVDTFCLDRDRDELLGATDEIPPADVSPDNLVYVIYTSGSTGHPKGVSVTHRNLVNYSHDMCRQIGARHGLQWATVSTLAADLGNTAIFPSLISGGCLHILEQQATVDSGRFIEYLSTHPIDVLKIVPSHLAALLPPDADATWLPRETLVLGGEALSMDMARRLRVWSNDIALINHYGPTETTVGTLTFRMPMAYEAGSRVATIPIGRPIANAEVCVVDERFEIVPVGVPGELCVGGVGVARGYLNQPAATAERFVPDPFGSEGSRLYRTGDLVRQLADGTIEFLGRIDQQVKIRGFRIEPGEIETVLKFHTHIRDAVVLAREDNPGDKRLVAYVVADKTRFDAGELRIALQAHLPEYMSPMVFVRLDHLPLTANGKVDRKRLPVPDVAATLQTTYVAPRTPTEEILVGTWSSILKLDRLGIHDNFFEVGGHSLFATQVISRVRQIFAIELPLRVLFEEPTIAGLASCVEQEKNRSGLIQAPPMVPTPKDKPLPLSFAQQRLWFLAQLEPENPFYNMARVLHLSGTLDIAILTRIVNEIVCRHESLRTTFSVIEGQPVQMIAKEHAIVIPLTDLSGLPLEVAEAEAKRLEQDEAKRPFALEREIPIRARLIKIGEGEYRLLFTLHHIASDGWSMGVLVKEVIALYEASLRNAPSPLPLLPVQYADFAHWQRQWLTGAVLDRQVEYWRNRLAGAPTLLEIPTDFPRPAVQTYNGTSHWFTLDAQLVDGLQQLSQSCGATLYMVLLAAFDILLFRYSGQTDLCVGTAIANRNRAEIENLVGFFVNALVMRTDVSGDPTFIELVTQVREVALGAYAHQDLPFEYLVEMLKPERNMSHAPLFQVSLVLQNVPIGNLQLPGLDLKPARGQNNTTKFDLTLRISGLSAEIEYNTDLYRAETIARMGEQWQRLLEAIVEDPQRH